MRSMLAGLNLVGGMKNETYLRTVSEAAALVHERIPSVDAADLERAIAKLCAESGVKV
jgi:hypothetical protein